MDKCFVWNCSTKCAVKLRTARLILQCLQILVWGKRLWMLCCPVWLKALREDDLPLKESYQILCHASSRFLIEINQHA